MKKTLKKLINIIPRRKKRTILMKELSMEEQETKELFNIATTYVDEFFNVNTKHYTYIKKIHSNIATNLRKIIWKESSDSIKDFAQKTEVPLRYLADWLGKNSLDDYSVAHFIHMCHVLGFELPYELIKEPDENK